ncbi:hypothetical protein BKA80DRAFT_282311 [Phyllosticta citrichinensis]
MSFGRDVFVINPLEVACGGWRMQQLRWRRLKSKQRQWSDSISGLDASYAAAMQTDPTNIKIDSSRVVCGGLEPPKASPLRLQSEAAAMTSLRARQAAGHATVDRKQTAERRDCLRCSALSTSAQIQNCRLVERRPSSPSSKLLFSLVRIFCIPPSLIPTVYSHARRSHAQGMDFSD